MPDEFTTRTSKKFGERGNFVYGETEKTTNLDDLSEVTQEIEIPFCNCGTPLLVETVDAYRCVECNDLTCRSCKITLSRYTYCLVCTQQRYGLDKRTFLSLVFLQHGLLEPNDLIQVTTQGGEVIELAIDPAANTVMAHGYLTEDGGLSPVGAEAISAGQQIYGDDRDVRSVLEQIRFQEVVNG